MKRLTLFVAMFAGMVTTLHAQKVLTVAQDESGDYSTIQAAVDAVAELMVRDPKIEMQNLDW